jgi:hypothetical protein
MAANFGGIDRTLRIVAGIAVLALFFVLEGNARYWALVGLVPLFTGIFSFCPLNAVLGLNLSDEAGLTTRRQPSDADTQRASASAPMAPGWRATSWPRLNTISVGMLRIP